MPMPNPTDRGTPRRVAWLTLLVAGGGACGPAVRPPDPPWGPSSIAKLEARSAVAVGGRQIVVGEMCPQGAAGRPAVVPLVQRTGAWDDTAEVLASTIERGSAPRFVVFGTDGKAAGVFDTVGLADIGIARDVASGTYVGASPCTAAGGKGVRLEDPACVPATAGCGLAVAEIVRPDDAPSTPTFSTGGACLSGDAIAVDIDGDGQPELFPLASALDPIRGPAPEWSAAPAGGPPCTPSFQLYDIKLARQPEPGKPVDTRSVITLDVLGVLDLDGDGRRELVTAMRFPTVRTILVYAAAGSPQRLELAGEAEAFPR